MHVGSGDGAATLDAAAIRDAYTDTGGDVMRYRARLMELMDVGDGMTA